MTSNAQLDIISDGSVVSSLNVAVQSLKSEQLPASERHVQRYDFDCVSVQT